jgi:hypothetical protein
MRPIPVLLVAGAIAGALGASALVIGTGASAQGAHDPPRAGRPAALSLAQDQEPGESKPGKALNTIAEVFAAIDACWIPPSLDPARPGMQITVMLSFKRSGELLGKPRITYVTPQATNDQRMSYRAAVAQAVERCMPLHFTDALGNALAGRPMTVRFIDNRNLIRTEGTHHDRQG